MTQKLVVVGASAGGLKGLQEFVAGFPAGPPARLLVGLYLRQIGRALGRGKV